MNYTDYASIISTMYSKSSVVTISSRPSHKRSTLAPARRAAGPGSGMPFSFRKQLVKLNKLGRDVLVRIGAKVRGHLSRFSIFIYIMYIYTKMYLYIYIYNIRLHNIILYYIILHCTILHYIMYSSIVIFISWLLMCENAHLAAILTSHLWSYQCPLLASPWSSSRYPSLLLRTRRWSFPGDNPQGPHGNPHGSQKIEFLKVLDPRLLQKKNMDERDIHSFSVSFSGRVLSHHSFQASDVHVLRW